MRHRDGNFLHFLPMYVIKCWIYSLEILVVVIVLESIALCSLLHVHVLSAEHRWVVGIHNT